MSCDGVFFSKGEGTEPMIARGMGLPVKMDGAVDFVVMCMLEGRRSGCLRLIEYLPESKPVPGRRFRILLAYGDRGHSTHRCCTVDLWILLAIVVVL